MGSGSPAVVHDVVYNSDGRGIVVALDLATGESLWEGDVGAPANSGISVADGLVLVGDVDGVVHALATSDGSERWNYEAGARLSGPPAILDGVSYLGTIDGQLHAIDLATGHSVWSAPVQTAGPVGRSVAAADGLVYVGSAGLAPEAPATLAAYDAASGELRWRQPLQAGSPGSPGIADGLVFTAGSLDTGAEPSKAYAFDAVDGTPAWDEPFVSPTQANLYRAAVTGDRLYLVSNDGWAYTLDARDGHLLWSTAISAGESPNGAWLDGTLIITGGGQSVFALDSLDGAELWRFPVGAAARAPAIVDGHIVLGTEMGTLLSLGDPEPSSR